jgi:hypothetical protein
VAVRGKDHHQGLARTHRLQDGTVYFFLTHSEVGPGEQGQLMQFRYDGPLQGEHIAASDPLPVAGMTEQIYLHEPHPCDIQFLPDVNSADAGYLFVVEAFLTQRITVWAWGPRDKSAPPRRHRPGLPAEPAAEFRIRRRNPNRPMSSHHACMPR